MIRGLLGKKLGMSQIFDKDGNMIPVTVVEAGPCTILGVTEAPEKPATTPGGSAKKCGGKVTLGFLPVKESRASNPRLGFFKKLKTAPLRHVREFESDDNKDYAVGKELKADVFKAGDFVDVSGVSKGKGFQGGMKRWHWAGGPAGHGSMHHRRVGSIGSSADPSRTFKGQHMPGHMGSKRTVVQGLRVVGVDVENNLLLIKGAVPGSRNTLLTINRSKKKAFQSLEQKTAAVVHKRNPMKQSKAKAGKKTGKK